MIFLVVLVHCGLVYESTGVGGLFWLVDDPSVNGLAGIVNFIVDLFVMPTMFFVSGYFAYVSLKQRGGWAFLKSKFRRLMIPWLLAVLTLMPLYKIIFLVSRRMPQESWTSYFHFSNGIFSQNWLWFLPVLFLFDVLYVLFSTGKIKLPKIPFPWAVAIAFLVCWAYGVCLRIFGWEGWTKTFIIDFQNERLLVYFVAFLLGSLGSRWNVFESNDAKKKSLLILLPATAIPILAYRHFQLRAFVFPRSYIVSGVSDAILSQFFLLLSVLSLMILSIHAFQLFRNRSGKLAGELNRNSYGVYIVHVIVLGGIALFLLETTLPSLPKYLLLTTAAYVLSNVIVSSYRYFIKTRIAAWVAGRMYP